MSLNRSMIAVGLLILMLSGTAMAHHSYAMFDKSREVILNGTVKKFEYSGPHAWVYLVVTDELGQVVNWSLECRSPEELSRQGLRSVDIKPGDKLSATIYVARDGSKFGAVLRAATDTGKQFGRTRDDLRKGTNASL